MTIPAHITVLVDAFKTASDPEVYRPTFSDEQWSKLAAYLSPIALQESNLLYKRGATEKTLYFIESGRITVHYENGQGKLRMCIVDPGNFLGEASFLGQQNRLATAQVAAAGKGWVLSPLKFNEMINRSPELALAVTQQASYVLAHRVANRNRRVAIS